ncbi:hypothetical protein ACTZWT_04955 [Rhodopseudomonas sp. NSM]
MAGIMLGWLCKLLKYKFARSASADHSSVAAGGDINNTTINIGLNKNEIGHLIEQGNLAVVDSVHSLAAEVARHRGLDPAPFRKILANLGEHQVSDEEISNRFVELIGTLDELRQRLGNKHLDELRPMRTKALELLDAGDFSGAYSALEEGRLLAQAHRCQASGSEAEILADQGRVLELQISNIPASEKYAQAALLSAGDPISAFEYLVKQANALQNEGEEFGNKDALRESILIWRKAKTIAPFEIAPDRHRKAHNNLGSAVYSLALLEPTNENLLEVAKMNREVLDRDSCDIAPQVWIAAQANLASTLLELGERELGTDKLEEALERFNIALSAIDRKERPADWAGIKNNIGNALMRIGQRQASSDYLDRSIGAFNEALEALDPTMECNRAMILMNLAAVHADLGRLLNRAEPLEQSIKDAEAALALTQKSRYPVRWAQIKNNIGSARSSLGLITNDISHWQDAIVVNREALSVHTIGHAPLKWAMSQWGIGLALSKIAATTSDLQAATEAVDILNEANSIIAKSDNESMKMGVFGALTEAKDLAIGLQNRESYKVE